MTTTQAANHEPSGKGRFPAQLLVYAALTVGCGLGPLVLGWTHDRLRVFTWLIGVLGYRIIEETGFHPDQSAGVRRAEWLFYALYLGLGGSVLLPAIEFAFLERPFQLPVYIIGVGAVALGAYLRYQGVATLGRHFSTHIEVRRDHQLITAGVYSYIRHPSYTGVMSFTLGGALVLHSWFSLAFIVFYFWPLIATRIRIEEEELGARLNGYGEYCRRTKRLVPGVF